MRPASSPGGLVTRETDKWRQRKQKNAFFLRYGFERGDRRKTWRPDRKIGRKSAKNAIKQAGSVLVRFRCRSERSPAAELRRCGEPPSRRGGSIGRRRTAFPLSRRCPRLHFRRIRAILLPVAEPCPVDPVRVGDYPVTVSPSRAEAQVRPRRLCPQPAALVRETQERGQGIMDFRDPVAETSRSASTRFPGRRRHGS